MNKEPQTAAAPPSEHDDGLSDRTVRRLPYLGIILWYVLTKVFTVLSWSWAAEYTVLAFVCVYPPLCWGVSVYVRHRARRRAEIAGSSRFRSE